MSRAAADQFENELIASVEKEIRQWELLTNWIYPVGNVLLALGILCPLLAAQKPTDHLLQALTVIAGILGTAAVSLYSSFHIPETINRIDRARSRLQAALEDHKLARHYNKLDQYESLKLLKNEKQAAIEIFLGLKDQRPTAGNDSAKKIKKPGSDYTPTNVGHPDKEDGQQ